MKINNETKVGAIAVVAIALLILGFNFLRGKKVFSKSTTLYGNYTNVEGLQNSNPVIVNGLQVGTVYKISTDKDMSNIKVELNITKDINIPKNSVAIIKPNPIGTTSIEIALGTDPANLKDGDVIFTKANAGMFNDIIKKVDPVLYQVTMAVASLDTLVKNFNTVLDPNTKGNIAATFDNLRVLSSSMTLSSASLQSLLNERTGALAKSLENVQVITANLANNNARINSVVGNLDQATAKLARIEIQKTFDTLDVAVNQLKGMVSKLNSKDGTLGKLLNDPVMYQNFASSGNKLNLLLDDIRLHPKRYVSISVFGKKTTSEPLKVPLPDTLNSPYYIETVPGPAVKF